MAGQRAREIPGKRRAAARERRGHCVRARRLGKLFAARKRNADLGSGKLTLHTKDARALPKKKDNNTTKKTTDVGIFS